jgi:SAM-dependent methyltransferase
VQLESWPAKGRREPPREGPTYNLLAPLAAWVKAQAEDTHRNKGPYRVLDVGCGSKPYYPFFHGLVSEYVGVDPVNPDAEVKGSVEEIPVEDGGFDLVLCTQVLEHCDDPARAVRELRRVTAPGGRVLASTHGVMAYHPSPDDHWRWTHTGLRLLFERNGDWASVDVTPNAGTASCVATILAMYVHLLGKRAGLQPLSGTVIRGLNRLGPAIDRRSPLLREPVPGTLFMNYHVRGEVAA